MYLVKQFPPNNIHLMPNTQIYFMSNLLKMKRKGAVKTQEVI